MFFTLVSVSNCECAIEQGLLEGVITIQMAAEFSCICSNSGTSFSDSVLPISSLCPSSASKKTAFRFDLSSCESFLWTISNDMI